MKITWKKAGQYAWWGLAPSGMIICKITDFVQGWVRLYRQAYVTADQKDLTFDFDTADHAKEWAERWAEPYYED